MVDTGVDAENRQGGSGQAYRAVRDRRQAEPEKAPQKEGDNKDDSHDPLLRTLLKKLFVRPSQVPDCTRGGARELELVGPYTGKGMLVHHRERLVPELEPVGAQRVGHSPKGLLASSLG